jgi:hypothetical protein
MTTTQNYNPLRNALVELTTPEAQHWYRTQAKTTATLAKMIAHYSFTTAQRLLSDRKPVALAAIAEPELAQTIAPAVQDDGDAVAGLENAILTLPESALEQEHALSEATEPEESPVSNDWEEIAPATAPEPEPDDSEGDANAPRVRIAIDEPEQAIASTELKQAISLSDAETNAPEPDDGEAITELSGVDEALLDDEDPTERRYWAGDDAEGVESPFMSHQWEDDAEALAGEEACRR